MRTVIGISVDGPWCHAAFAQDRKLHFPLLADFEPKGEVSRRYGVYQLPEGISERALFVIDAEGIDALELRVAQSASIPAPTASSKRWKNCRHQGVASMSQLKPDVGPPTMRRARGTRRLVLVEYGDFQCPYCGEQYPEIKAVQEAMGDDLCFVFRHFPLARGASARRTCRRADRSRGYGRQVLGNA